MIPQDPVMLLSFINLKLRDYYGSLEQLCDDLDVKEQEIRDKLASIDYHYNEERNQLDVYKRQEQRTTGRHMWWVRIIIHHGVVCRMVYSNMLPVV